MSALVIIETIVFLAHTAGIFLAIRSVFDTRTSQGAIAWFISLVTFPYLAVPLYLIFGRDKFKGYAEALREIEIFSPSERAELKAKVASFAKELPASAHLAENVFEHLTFLPFTDSNSVELLIDGEQTFEAIFNAIRAAKEYVLIEFFIIKDDMLGQELKQLLIDRAHSGVRIYLLYDAVGSHALSDLYVSELRAAGVSVASFYSSQSRGSRYQFNFRNHRKIVVVDGAVAFVGGHNVGDEYLGKNPKFGHWRDTHIKLKGPAVICVQLIFLADWIWSTSSKLALNWTPQAAPDGRAAVLPLQTGPVELREGCTLMFLQLIGMASNRLWIASPYFVPDEAVLMALQLAAARGVDVRILIPSHADHLFVYLASFSYIVETLSAGIKLYRYQPGFLHQKVVLVDDSWAAVGTANLDNRSFRLNFEVTALVFDPEFNTKVTQMLEKDFALSKLVTKDEYEARNFLSKTSVKVARLLAPIL